MVDHRHQRGIKPARDGLADPAHADDADLAVAQRADAERIVLGLPQPGADIAVGLDELAQGRDQKAHRDVGDLLGQDVGRVGDDDAVLGRIFGIDVVVADAEARHHLNLGQLRQRILVRTHGVVGHRDAADPVADRGRQALEIAARLRLVHDEMIGKAVLEDRPHRPIDQKVDLFGRNRTGSHQFSFPSALSCQRRKTRWETSASTP